MPRAINREGTIKFDISDADDDQPPESVAADAAQSPQPIRLTVQDADTFSITFDQEATAALGKIRDVMPKANGLGDVVFTAVQLLAYSLNYDVIIQGREPRGRKRITGLWTASD